jgi:hypothetical protein
MHIFVSNPHLSVNGWLIQLRVSCCFEIVHLSFGVQGSLCTRTCLCCVVECACRGSSEHIFIQGLVQLNLRVVGCPPTFSHGPFCSRPALIMSMHLLCVSGTLA